MHSAGGRLVRGSHRRRGCIRSGLGFGLGLGLGIEIRAVERVPGSMRSTKRQQRRCPRRRLFGECSPETAKSGPFSRKATRSSSRFAEMMVRASSALLNSGTTRRPPPRWRISSPSRPQLATGCIRRAVIVSPRCQPSLPVTRIVGVSVGVHPGGYWDADGHPIASQCVRITTRNSTLMACSSPITKQAHLWPTHGRPARP